ncbi:lipocalin family protein [Arcobacter sp. KX21116]|uniref:lipocalin family protein n=1 Tax=Arcobacter iocasae TaxID=2906515 RepID=UPI0035D3E32F
MSQLVNFFRPFYGNYWVLMLDKDYKYALIGEPSREYLWILSRTKKLDKETLNKILDSLPALGYTKDKLIWTIQE